MCLPLQTLCNEEEHGMVRHEAAEAIGAIGNEECVALLERYQRDKEELVRESFEVSLDAVDYWATTCVAEESA